MKTLKYKDIGQKESERSESEMIFNDLLNQYITQLGCTAKELSETTGLSPASLSRYRTGERMPNQE